MFVIGEVNGNYESLYKKLEKSNLRSDNLIQLGNFGLKNRYDELNKPEILRLNELLHSFNSHLFMIRGNNDSPHFFVSSFDNYLSNVHFIEDYTVLEIEDKKIFVMGGGKSIDFKQKDKGGLSPANENIDFNFTRLEKLRGIDFIATHKPPPYVFDSLLPDFYGYWVRGDACLENQLAKERDNMRRMTKQIIKNNKITHWVSAHLKLTAEKTEEGIKYVSLNQLEFYQL